MGCYRVLRLMTLDFPNLPVILEFDKSSLIALPLASKSTPCRAKLVIALSSIPSVNRPHPFLFDSVLSLSLS